MRNTLQRLADWFLSNCDGDWEHSAGITIGSLDNPGWRLEIALVGTRLEGTSFDPFEDQYEHPENWLRCWVEDGKFHGACGVTRLEDALLVFLSWANA
jgi:hypothetical protein